MVAETALVEHSLLVKLSGSQSWFGPGTSLNLTLGASRGGQSSFGAGRDVTAVQQPFI
jgi:hypothetical protein